MWLGVQRHGPGALPRERDPVGPVWSGAENLAAIETRSPDRPARSGSLYRLSYPGPHTAIKAYMKKPVFIGKELCTDARVLFSLSREEHIKTAHKCVISS